MNTLPAIKLNTLAALLKIAGKKDARYYLNGVYIDPVKGHAVATDGHIGLIVALPWKDATIEPFIIPRDLIETAVKATSKRGEQLVIVSIDDFKGIRTRTLELSTSAGKFGAPEIDGRFPDYLRIVPQTISGVQSEQYDPASLVRMQEALVLLAGKCWLDLHHNGNGAAVCTTKDADCIGLIMPRRDGGAGRSAVNNAYVAIGQSAPRFGGVQS